MRVLVLGAGRMGLGTCFDLVRSPRVEAVTVADINRERAEAVVKQLASPRIRAATVDVTNLPEVIRMMRGHHSVVSCVVYLHNLRLARAAIEARVNFCDLGGNNNIVSAELALDTEARAAGIRIIPDCGLAPGMVSVLAVHGAKRFDQLEVLRIRVGGLPQKPQPPLNYQIVFSIDGLINEYVEPARIIRDGRIAEVDSMTEVEELEFPSPYGVLEAFHTSGGISTLPECFFGKVKELNYKTLRYRGHCQQIRLLMDLGMASSDTVPVDGMPVVPRHLLRELLARGIPADGPDVVLIRLEFYGIKGGNSQSLVFDIIDSSDDENGLSAMMRTTSFPASIVSQMMANGDISAFGAMTQERCVPTNLFVAALAERGIRLLERMDSLKRG